MRYEKSRDESMEKIKVLQFITPSGFYGAERWILALANNLDPNEVVCDLAVTQESDGQDLSVADYYPTSSGQVHCLPMRGRFDFKVVNKLVEIIRKRRIDVIHTHGYKSDILGLVAARKAGIKCVSTPHGFSKPIGLKLKLFIKLGTSLLRFFDAVAPLSEELVEDMKRFKVPENKTVFIRNGVDLKEIDSTLSDIKLNNGEASKGSVKTVGFIGQLIPRKGITDLIEMFDQLHRSSSDICLKILGDGSQRTELEAFANAKPCRESIEFMGFRDDRLEVLSKFDLFVMTSSLEGIPRCMMEAMAAGVAVAAYDIPGVDKLIEHEETGLLTPLGDIKGLKECCERLLSDQFLSDSIVEKARKKIESSYSARRMAQEYQALFSELLNRTPINQMSMESAD